MNNETVLSAHPVSDEMRATVIENLAALERQHQVKVLFACESGSRGWGFASPDSDYDVRFVYINRLPWYLTVEPGRDVIEQPISGELDINGWDLRKTLQLLRESNPTLLEWLRSPIVYQQEADWVARLRTLAEEGFSPVRGYHHYVSMARKNLREHLYGEAVRYKKYLYVLRPLLAARWIREGRGVPPMRFAELASQILTDSAVLTEVNALLEVKMRAGESATSPRWVGIHDFIEAELAEAMDHTPDKGPKADERQLDQYLHDAALRFDSRT
ncbi:MULTISPECIES: nucleotidyltransferase domain-containing protein [unclassified Roseateles]|uniref:nucleotidyltransferase domain-containing protein n=1 Tax=unclassified Roseateles TaxID=2626991 RepID=UPI000701735E|nr:MULTISPECIES: nucleotidyltransferase domain-containing protein [unclassified Roseateles]KQW45316.1 nucleotidyltransferase [Pelomonas sp. Root405]KRA72694.1 nucleotidyltransferase [Pelomonas sp. Root662]